jgi:hypothetical protein
VDLRNPRCSSYPVAEGSIRIEVWASTLSGIPGLRKGNRGMATGGADDKALKCRIRHGS